MLVPTLLVRSGHKLVTKFYGKEIYLQTRNFKALYKYPTNNGLQKPETSL
jgi:hypothetical protein